MSSPVTVDHAWSYRKTSNRADHAGQLGGPLRHRNFAHLLVAMTLMLALFGNAPSAVAATQCTAPYEVTKTPNGAFMKLRWTWTVTCAPNLAFARITSRLTTGAGGTTEATGTLSSCFGCPGGTSTGEFPYAIKGTTHVLHLVYDLTTGDGSIWAPIQGDQAIACRGAGTPTVHCEYLRPVVVPLVREE